MIFFGKSGPWPWSQEHSRSILCGLGVGLATAGLDYISGLNQWRHFCCPIDEKSEWLEVILHCYLVSNIVAVTVAGKPVSDKCRSKQKLKCGLSTEVIKVGQHIDIADTHTNYRHCFCLYGFSHSIYFVFFLFYIKFKFCRKYFRRSHWTLFAEMKVSSAHRICAC